MFVLSENSPHRWADCACWIVGADALILTIWQQFEQIDSDGELRRGMKSRRAGILEAPICIIGHFVQATVLLIVRGLSGDGSCPAANFDPDPS